MTEQIGYLASLVVMASFLMKEMTKLRLINMIGCSLFVLYGFFLNISWPIVITNLFIFCINFYHLLKSKK